MASDLIVTATVENGRQVGNARHPSAWKSPRGSPKAAAVSSLTTGPTLLVKNFLNVMDTNWKVESRRHLVPVQSPHLSLVPCLKLDFAQEADPPGPVIRRPQAICFCKNCMLLLLLATASHSSTQCQRDSKLGLGSLLPGKVEPVYRWPRKP